MVEWLRLFFFCVYRSSGLWMYGSFWCGFRFPGLCLVFGFCVSPLCCDEWRCFRLVLWPIFRKSVFLRIVFLASTSADLFSLRIHFALTWNFSGLLSHHRRRFFFCFSNFLGSWRTWFGRCDDSFCPFQTFYGLKKESALFVGCSLTSSVCMVEEKNVILLFFHLTSVKLFPVLL